MIGTLARTAGAALLACAWLTIAPPGPAWAARDEAGPVEAAEPARLRALAEAGDPDAQYALAHAYHLGRGVDQDMAAALHWYRMAALQGDERAQLALGDQYRIGRAVPQDLAQATRWYRMAAEQGNAFAQYELGNAYRYGKGVNKSLVQAIQWFVLSAEAGNPSAELALAELEAADAAGDPVADPVADRVVEPVADPVDGQVAGLLARADAQAARLALTTPPGDNAHETYREILAVQPDNEAALAGIKRLGATYADLARRAAAKGDLRAARRYAAKAEALAPDHPAVRDLAVRDLAIAVAPAPPPPKAKPSKAKPEVAKPEVAKPERATAATEVAAPIPAPIPGPAPGASEAAAAPGLEADADDVVFHPHAYQGREVVVSGAVVHLLGRYRLRSDSGQNSLVVNVEALSPADRARLQDAIREAGFLGEVAARITGRVERQSPITFQLTAREVILGAPGRGASGQGAAARGAAAPEDPAPGAVGRRGETPEPGLGAAGTPVVLLEPGDPAETPRAAEKSPAPVYAQPASTRAPRCVRDRVWRRLADGRIQTGVRTRCY
ncbi:MAG: tetratricopeptide repeat protein [Kiloniellales bacterium]|nr:tetratricopeptide repeat protein [Kiloniellales bacterium]